jgi:hypothetical protein
MNSLIYSMHITTLFISVFCFSQINEEMRRHRRRKVSTVKLLFCCRFSPSSRPHLPSKFTGIPDNFSTSQWFLSMLTTTSSIFVFGSRKTVPDFRRGHDFKNCAHSLSTGTRCHDLQFVVSYSVNFLATLYVACILLSIKSEHAAHWHHPCSLILFASVPAQFKLSFQKICNQIVF